MRAIIHELAQGLRHLLYPGVCIVCDQSLTPEQSGFCARCRETLTQDPHATCPRCSSSVGPFAQATRETGCSECRSHSFHFEQVFRCGPYMGLLREQVLRMKSLSGEDLARLLGRLWAEDMRSRVETLDIEVVIPVPLHWWKRLTRGYNSPEVLAQEWADVLGRPCRPRWLRRTRWTVQQNRLPPSARRDNVRGAFRAAQAVRGQTVLLIDDVLTTGSTASEAARALAEAGARRVIVAVLAHG